MLSIIAPTGEYDPASWDKVIALNLNGIVYACRYQIEQMLKNGGGSIVNIASIHGTVAGLLKTKTTGKSGDFRIYSSFCF